MIYGITRIELLQIQSVIDHLSNGKLVKKEDLNHVNDTIDAILEKKIEVVPAPTLEEELEKEIAEDEELAEEIKSSSTDALDSEDIIFTDMDQFPGETE